MQLSAVPCAIEARGSERSAKQLVDRGVANPEGNPLIQRPTGLPDGRQVDFDLEIQLAGELPHE